MWFSIKRDANVNDWKYIYFNLWRWRFWHELEIFFSRSCHVWNWRQKTLTNGFIRTFAIFFFFFFYFLININQHTLTNTHKIALSRLYAFIYLLPIIYQRNIYISIIYFIILYYLHVNYKWITGKKINSTWFPLCDRVLNINKTF